MEALNSKNKEDFASYPNTLANDPVKNIIKRIKKNYNMETGKNLPLVEKFSNQYRLQENFNLQNNDIKYGDKIVISKK